MATQLLTVDVLPVPAVLATGAAVVMGTAALLTNRSATRPELPAQRWYRPLPWALATVAGRNAGRVVLRSAGLASVALLLRAAWIADGPVRGGAVVAWIVAAAALTGPMPRIANPVRLAIPRGTDTDQERRETIGWPAVAGLAALSAVVLTVSDGRALAAILGGHLLLQGALTRWRGARWPAYGDAIDALSAVAGLVAPVGRALDGRLSWRNPVVHAAHASPGSAAVWLTAVVMALALTGAMSGDGTTSAPVAVTQFAVIAVTAGLVLRAGLTHAYFLGSVGPLTVAYGLLAGGRWLAPLDLVAFVALHAVAIGVLHRQAIARYDPRAARAVQFLARSMVVVSVLVGLAVFTAA